MQPVKTPALSSDILKNPSPEITDILQAFGQEYHQRWPWIIIGKTQRTQGWKLHLSSTPAEISSLFACVFPILKRFGVPFKIVEDIPTCALLNEGSFGATQIGKCMTIYADEIEDVDGLADALVKATAPFQGPEIISDLYLGGRVFTRYGGFNPVIERDTLGQIQSYIYLPDGTKTPDGYGDPAQYLAFGNFPFAREKYMLALPSILPQHHVLQEKYLIVDALDHRPRGATFQAMDITQQDNIRPKMVKQGRFFTLSDMHGRDIRDRFRHELAMYQAVKQAGIMPACEEYFEDGHSAYLVFDYIYGESLESRVSTIRKQQHWQFLDKERQLCILSLLETAARCIARLHEAGIVHRDISVSNLHVDEEDKVMLIDLELAQFQYAEEKPFGKGTPGFMSPEQEHYAPATFAQDVYGLGAVMLFSLTGIDPRRFRLQETQSHQDICLLFPNLPKSFYDCLLSCFCKAPELRPSLEDVLTEIALAKEHINKQSEYASRLRPTRKELHTRALDCLHEGLKGLEHLCVSRPQDGMWLSAPVTHGGRLASQVQPLEQRRSLNRGVAGICYLLGVMAKADATLPDMYPSLFTRGKNAAQWLLQGESTPDIAMPGLHFGEAGVALALREMERANLISVTPEAYAPITHAAFAKASPWPDITHGAAGQGLTALAILGTTVADDVHPLAHECAALLMDTQADNGSWKMPEGVPGMSGETLTGFAHGVAGIGYFLTEYAARTGRKDALAAAMKAAEWLESMAIQQENGRLAWRYSDTNQSIWQWWCHGAMGISTFFRALWKLTGQNRYAALLDASLYLPVEGFSATNLTLCHGMSGLGLHLLEAFNATQNERYLHDAEQVIEQLLNRAIRTPKGAGWIVEDPHYFTGDLLVGMGGPLLLLFYYAKAKEQAQFPGNLSPIYAS